MNFLRRSGHCCPAVTVPPPVSPSLFASAGALYLHHVHLQHSEAPFCFKFVLNCRKINF